MYKKQILTIILVSGPYAVVPAASWAQTYPNKTVRLVLPFAAGSAVDVLARHYAQKMSEQWKQQVVVDNRTGANGIIGMEAIARAPADGYTVGMGNVATLAINPHLYSKLPYDSIADFIGGFGFAKAEHNHGQAAVFVEAFADLRVAADQIERAGDHAGELELVQHALDVGVKLMQAGNGDEGGRVRGKCLEECHRVGRPGGAGIRLFRGRWICGMHKAREHH